MSDSYRFGHFEVRSGERQLLVNGKPAPLGSRAFDLLIALIERRERVVEKNELLDLVWPGVVVEENNLQVQINTLRKLLGPQAIATVSGRGYRFTALSQPHEAGAPTSQPAGDPLPRLLTSFVGRESELETLTRLLGSSRLLSLTGIGGGGKTRLAIEFGRRVAQSYPDGVWFADLAPVNTPDRVALEVARAAGVTEEPNRPVQDKLVQQFARRTALLILDNCEHVLDACAALVEHLLIGSERLRVVVTSREALGVSGEQVFGVPSLSLPAAGTGVEAAVASEAVQLFIHRAHLVLPEFMLDAQNVAAVIEICRRLDGIPLAIELAAARLRALSVEQIRDKLGDRFRLLTGGSRAVPRHQTLQATLHWSYEHLSADEQSLLRRLSVFAGGWTLEAAFAVAGQGESETDLVDRLEHLFDKSLITVDHSSRGSTRYGMLETVRQYALDRLQEAGEADATRTRHVQVYVALAEQVESDPSARAQGEWLARLDPELDNFLAAHAWCDHAEGGAELGLRLVFALEWYLRKKLRLLMVGHRVIVEALARPDGRGCTLARCRALWGASELSYFLGRYAEAKERVEESLAIAREIGDSARVAEALRLLGYVLIAHDEREAARAHFQEALALSRELGDKHRLARTLTGLAELHRAEVELATAVPIYEEATALSRELGDLRGIAVNLCNLARAQIDLGYGDRARGTLFEALAVVGETGSTHLGLAMLETCVGLAAALGKAGLAARLHGAAEAQVAGSGYQREPVDEQFLRPLIAQAREALGAAEFAVTEAAGRALSFEEATEEARAWLGSRA